MLYLNTGFDPIERPSYNELAHPFIVREASESFACYRCLTDHNYAVVSVSSDLGCLRHLICFNPSDTYQDSVEEETSRLFTSTWSPWRAADR